jgi:hypothetical protein
LEAGGFDFVILQRFGGIGLDFDAEEVVRGDVERGEMAGGS